jgi:hypothetical protein
MHYAWGSALWEGGGLFWSSGPLSAPESHLRPGPDCRNGPILNPDSLLHTNVFKSMAGGGYPSTFAILAITKLFSVNVESIRDSVATSCTWSFRLF